MSPRTVLVVDADPGIRALVRRFLTHTGYALCEAGSSDAALRILGTTPIDLLLIDQDLHGMSGTALLAYLRTTEAYQSTPVILMGGELAIALGAGLPAYEPTFLLEKPFSRRDLLVLL